MSNAWLIIGSIGIVILTGPRVFRRLQLSRAKHPSLRGHSKMASRIARLLPFYEYDDETFFRCDDAPEDIADRRRVAFDSLGERLRRDSPKTIEQSEELVGAVSDVEFTNAYRVPFQFRGLTSRHLKVGNMLDATEGTRVRDLDGNWAYDLTGAYGVNLFGYDFYKECLRQGAERAEALGPVLGPYHPIITDNVRRLRSISGMDEVSFHMSGTEAVMQAVRLARYHTRRPRLVRFCGSYHGWWDGVQPGVGNPRSVHDVYTLKEMDEATLTVLRTRTDIACVLVNPLQALNPNGAAQSDGALVVSDRAAHYDRDAYAAWLRQVREVCTARSIVLIFDEVFLGFRLAYRGAQEYFGVEADLVTYGKTLGGGLPVGVVCGRSALMKRYRDDRPADICFARGTFNSHPYVMATMNEFLRRIETEEIQRSYRDADETWNGRAEWLNKRLADLDLPIRVANMLSVWTTIYQIPSRYNWMFQYYLRAHGLALSWVGTGRFIFSHNYTDEDFSAVADRFVAAAEEMATDGWWWHAAGTTNKSMRRQILRELLRARFSRSSRSQDRHMPATARPGPWSRPRSPAVSRGLGAGSAK